MRIIVSRTDGIGDVVLTLPLLGLLKEQMPGVHLIFLNRSYTNAIVEACEHVDEILNWDSLEKKSILDQAEALRSLQADAIIHVFPQPDIARAAKQAGIPKRIGTTGRLYHIPTCNLLVRLSRKRSALHEAQLNLILLKPFKVKYKLPLRSVHQYYGLGKLQALPDWATALIDESKKNIVLHPLSKGSAVEWGMHNFNTLIDRLPASRFNIFLSGTEYEGNLFRSQLPIDRPNVHDLSGRLKLGELMTFISRCSGLVACSTGPLHIAAALGICSVGLYSSKRPIHPGRWAPLGQNATYLVQRLRRTAIHPLLVRPTIQKISPKLVEAKLLAC
jgi:heptosyltransferase-3